MRDFLEAVAVFAAFLIGSVAAAWVYWLLVIR